MSYYNHTTMKAPHIGIVPLVDEEKQSYWMLPGYMNGIIQEGGIPFMLPLTCDENMLTEIVMTIDGIVFPGGQDVSPALYNAQPIDQCGTPCRERDKMEILLLRLAMKRNIPILGICRGIQFINAALGGDLYQDLPGEHPSPIEHHQQAPYDMPVHSVTIKQATPLYKTLQKETIEVNSYHHQAIKTLAPNLEIMAKSSDGLIEAVYSPEHKFLWAIQWHPEFSYKSDLNSRKIFKTFIEHSQ